MNSFYVEAIRKFEGYTREAQWDYAQHTNGYGTRALYPGEVIDAAEAERRFRAEIANARQIVEREAPNVDEGTKAALTSLTYNAGTKWVSSGLGDAVRRGDMEAVRTLFLEYTKAGGKELPGLVSRRMAEAQWIDNPSAGQTDVASGGAPASPSRGPRVPPQLEVAQNVQMAALMKEERADARTPVDAGGATDGGGTSAAAAMLLRILDGAARDTALAGSSHLVRTSESLRLRAHDKEEDSGESRRRIDRA